MPNPVVNYIQRDPVKRPHIYEWKSDFAFQTEIYGEAGYGYFIRRKQTQINFTFPSNPYDGDVISIIDATKENELAQSEGTYINIKHPGTKVSYYGALYESDAEFYLNYLSDYQQYFLYVKSINTWIGSFIKIDATVVESLVQQIYGIVYYGVCNTPAATAAKVTTTDNSFVQTLGTHIRVVFKEANTISNPTLNVNGLGAAPIRLTKNTVGGPNYWLDGQAVDFVYDGYSWLIVDTASSGSGGGLGLTESDVNNLISIYLSQHNITGASPDTIRNFIREYLQQNGASAGFTETEIRQIIQNFLNSNGYLPGGGSSGGTNTGVTEERVNTLIATYIAQHNIGSGSSGGGLTSSQVNTLIANYIAQHNIGSGLSEQQVNTLIANYINSSDIGKGITYCTCSTNANTATKIAVIKDSTAQFSLKIGVSVRVKFTYGTSAVNPTLNVASTGALYIKSVGSTAAVSNQWQAGEVIDFVYDGSNWLVVDGSRNTNNLNNDIESIVQQLINTQIDSLISTKIQQAIDDVVSDVNTKLNLLKDEINVSITELADIVDGINGSINDTVSLALSQLNGEINTLKNEINETILDQINNVFNETIDQKIQAQFTGQITQLINSSRNDLEQQITDAKNNLTGIITDATSSLTRRIDDDISALTTQLNSSINTLTGNLNTAIASIRADVTDIINATFSNTIDQKINDAFNATIDDKIRAAFTDANGTLNAAIAGYEQQINIRLTDIETNINESIENLQQYFENEILVFKSDVQNIISNTFNTQIDDKIDNAFSTRLEQMINAQFSTVITSQINEELSSLRSTLNTEIQTATNNLNQIINDFSTTIDERITNIFNQEISGSLNTLKSELQTEIRTKINEINTTIDEKINTKFETSIDEIIETKFSNIIDQKISESFEDILDGKANAIKQEIYSDLSIRIDNAIETKFSNSFEGIIDGKVNAAKQEIFDELNTRIDARIRIAIDGEITTLINTKLEEYVAPAIGATY